MNAFHTLPYVVYIADAMYIWFRDKSIRISNILLSLIGELERLI